VKNETLEEIYKIRKENAKLFNYDLQDICNEFRKKLQVVGKLFQNHLSLLKSKRINHRFLLFKLKSC
jgi:hypothetical protein